MAKLIYISNTTLDGYVEDKEGKFDWAVPDAQYFEHINGIERSIGTYLFGRRMYETMVVWDTAHRVPGQAPFMPGLGAQEREFAELWRGAEKVVFSRSLKAVSSPKTRIETGFDPEAIRQLKAKAVKDMTVGGSELAGQMMKAGLVDEIHQFVAPVIVGGGKHWLPEGLRQELALLHESRLANGMLHLHYGCRINRI